MSDDGKAIGQVERVRREALLAMRLLHPSCLPAEQLLRCLMGVFSDLRWECLRRVLARSCRKGHLKQVDYHGAPCPRGVPWRRRRFSLTRRGLALADRVGGVAPLSCSKGNGAGL